MIFRRVGQFLTFCVAKGWAGRNFAAELPKIKVERDLPAILTPEQLGALINAARVTRLELSKARSPATDGTMLLYVLLAGFTGLRPAEAQKIGKGAFHLGGGLSCIEIGAKMAKVSQCRQIEVLDFLAGPLAEAVNDKQSWKNNQVFFNERLWKTIRKEAGVFDVWKNDILRHTFASWHYAIYKDVVRLAYTMGNSKEVLFSNYIRPMTESEGRRYGEALGVGR